MRQLVQNGYNADIDTAGAEDVWANGGDMNFAAAAAATTVLSSDAADDAAGTGARTVRVHGLDGDNREISEDATLDGTNAVSLSKQFKRVNSVEVLTAGSGGANAGTVDVKHGATVLQRMAIGANKSQSAMFTGGIKRQHKIKKIWVAILDATANVATFQLLTRKSGGVWQIRKTLAVHGSTFPYHEATVDIGLEPGEDAKIRCTVGADNTEVAADMLIESSAGVLA